jgi:hypothetical protein
MQEIIMLKYVRLRISEWSCQSLRCLLCPDSEILIRAVSRKEGTMWKHFSASHINPLSNLKKNDLIDELDSRDIEVYNLNKTDLRSKLSEILHGIQRPAALI